MKRLEGKTILIGKEPGQGRLLVSVVVNGHPKAAFIGQPGSVPDCVSRCRPAEGVAHCKIDVDADGTMRLTNLKSQNVTYVNGAEVQTKRITLSSIVALGYKRFALDLSGVMNAAKTLVGGGRDSGGKTPPEKPEYSVRHLELIWNEYTEGRKKIRLRQKNLNLLTGIPFAVSTILGAISAIIDMEEYIRNIVIVVAAVIVAISIYLRFTDKSIQEEEVLNDKFQDHYICPNPDCHHFMGNQAYKILRQSKKCPYCGCRLTDK